MYRTLNPPLEPPPDAGAEAGLRALAEIYAEAGLLTAAWAGRQGMGCPPGCGLCCEAFVPDALPIEAEYLALHLLSNQRAAAALLLAQPPVPAPVRCPFYDPSSAGHCSVYPARPLVCRLFGFAGMRRKSGGWSFRLCRHMPAPEGWAPTREISDLSHPLLQPPPIMSDIEARVQGLRCGAPDRREALPDAVRSALQRLLLRGALGDRADDPLRRAGGTAP